MFIAKNVLAVTSTDSWVWSMAEVIRGRGEEKEGVREEVKKGEKEGVRKRDGEREKVVMIKIQGEVILTA